MITREATLEDLKYIISLSQKESKAIGFIPKVAYEAAITGSKPSIHRWSDTCNDKIFVCVENSDPVGFVMASFGYSSKINQICIQEDARLFERGKELLNKVIKHGASRGKFDFSCGCADDLESNAFWKVMGWEKVGERNGISYKNTWKESSNRKINIYSWQEMSLFTKNRYQ